MWQRQLHKGRCSSAALQAKTVGLFLIGSVMIVPAIFVGGGESTGENARATVTERFQRPRKTFGKPAKFRGSWQIETTTEEKTSGNGEHPETLNLMIDRSREEVATAMIPDRSCERDVSDRIRSYSIIPPLRRRAVAPRVPRAPPLSNKEIAKALTTEINEQGLWDSDADRRVPEHASPDSRSKLIRRVINVGGEGGGRGGRGKKNRKRKRSSPTKVSGKSVRLFRRSETIGCSTSGSFQLARDKIVTACSSNACSGVPRTPFTLLVFQVQR
ncbi:hypothetical protein ALC56_12219 [Trachymyrmex septentrionalis]|uniref:Uncharacterized protein n=1 Tax=Trachymyrmex septentrionalis TaxID=34720 RepID=A0A195F020_9HYME|nr:hypothetical protein ALC56_12219 [Trachymyrmex septentrionalis]